MPFAEIWGHAESIDGWLTDKQGRALFGAAAAVAAGRPIVEIGSHHGRSTVVLARAKRTDVPLLAVDPYEDQRWGGGQNAVSVFHANLRAAGVHDDVALARKRGADAGRDWAGPPVGLLFVDGAHDYPSVAADLAAWIPHLAPGATVLMHDAFSSPGVTRAAFRMMFGNADWRYGGSIRSLARFQRNRAPRRMSMLWSGARMIARLEWFTRNIVVKIAIRRGWVRVPPLLGHRGMEYPY